MAESIRYRIARHLCAVFGSTEQWRAWQQDKDRGEFDAVAGEVLCLVDDHNRQRWTGLLAEIEEWKEASGLECGGDPDGVTPAKAKEFWSAESRRIEALQAENVRLQAENVRLQNGR
jgi:hypothetical protein